MKPTRSARHGHHPLASLLLASLFPSLPLVGQAGSVSGTISYDGAQTGPVWVQAVQTLSGNQVLSLDGNGDFASTTLTDLSGPEITVQYWFRGSSLQSAVRQQSDGYLVAGWNNRHILSHDGGTTGISAGERLTDGQWHHLVMTWKQGTAGGFASYLDGQLVQQRDSADTPIPNLNAQVYFGAFNGTGEFAQGQLDEIALWRRALTPAEIAANWNRRLTGSEPDLIGYWNFDDGTPNDASPNLYHAELWGDALIEPADIPGLGGGRATLRLEAPGPYEIAGLPDGPGYTVTAFRDVNGNGHRDPTEPFGAFASNPFTLAGTRTGVDMGLVEVPRITTQPRAQRTGVGESVTFTVEAAGSAPSPSSGARTIRR
ncbi:MAG: LamG domain-containing protein [Verrucomicrobia bacterium]|nr:LamG domain-containing protein [Verrucomicrobiota bacterium]